MAQIPTVPGTQMVQTPSAAVPIEAGSRIAAAGAEGRIGESLGHVSDVMQDVALRIQDAKNAGIRSSFENDLQRKFLDYQTSTIANQNPDTYVSGFQEVANDVANQHLNQTLAPALKRQMQQDYEHWKMQGETHFAQMAQQKTISISAEQHMNLAEEMLKGGTQKDIDNAKNVYDQGLKLGLWDVAKAETLKKRAEMVGQTNQVNTIIMNAPWELMQGGQYDLKNERNFKSLDPQHRLASYRAAEQAQHEIWRINTEKIELDIAERNDGIAKGDPNAGKFYDQETLTEMARNHQINGNSIKSLMKKQTTAFTADEVNEAINQIQIMGSKIDLTMSPSRKQMEVARIQTSKWWTMLSKDQQTTVKQALEDTIKNTGIPTNSIEEAVFKRAEEYYKLGYFVPPEKVEVSVEGTGFLGLPFFEKKVDVSRERKPEDLVKWKENLSKEEIDQADLNYARYKDAIRKFVKDNPNATEEDVQKFSASMNKSRVMQITASSLSRNVSMSYVKGQRARKDNVDYEYDGTKWVKIN